VIQNWAGKASLDESSVPVLICNSMGLSEVLCVGNAAACKSR